MYPAEHTVSNRLEKPTLEWAVARFNRKSTGSGTYLRVRIQDYTCEVVMKKRLVDLADALG